MKKTFSIKKLFKDSTEDYKKYWGMFLMIGIIFGLIAFVTNIGNVTAPYHHYGGGFGGGDSFFVIIISWLLQTFLSLGFIKMLLAMVDNKKVQLEDLFRGAGSFNHFLYFAVAMLLYSAIVGIGFVALIIPGIIFSILFIFVQYLVAEEREGIFESFKQSIAMTRGNRWKILWLMIVSLLFNLVGFLAFFVGLFITVPITYLVYARLYRRLMSGDSEPQREEVDTIIVEEELVIEETDQGNNNA